METNVPVASFTWWFDPEIQKIKNFGISGIDS